MWHSHHGLDCALLGLCIPQTPMPWLRSNPGRPCPAGLGAGPEEVATVMKRRKTPSQGERMLLVQQGWQRPSVPEQPLLPAPLHPPDTGISPSIPQRTLLSPPCEFTALRCFYCYSSLFQTPPLKSRDFSAASDIHFNGQSFQKVTTETLYGS